MTLSPEVKHMMQLLDGDSKPLAVEQAEIAYKAEIETKLYELRKKLNVETSNQQYYLGLIRQKLISNPEHFGDAVARQIDALITAILYKENPAMMERLSVLQSEVDNLTQELNQ